MPTDTDQKNFISKLFSYYKFSLFMENIFQSNAKTNELNFFDGNKYIEEIERGFNKAVMTAKDKKWTKFSIPNIIKQTKMFSQKVDNLSSDKKSNFFKTMEFIECSMSLSGKLLTNDFFIQDNSIQGNIKTNIENHQYFQLPEQNTYQYALGVYFIKQKPFSKKSDEYIPLFIIIFANNDMENKDVSLSVVFGQIKKFLGFQYNKELVDRDSNLCSPEIYLNPNAIEPYNAEYENYTAKDIEEAKQKADSFIDKYNIVNAHGADKIKKDIHLLAIGKNLTSALLRTLDSVKECGINQTLEKFYLIDKAKTSISASNLFKEDDIFNSSKVLESILGHYGTLDDENCLANTQRMVMSAYLKDARKIIPVNGAPGTGKTSVLKAIAADYIVKASIESLENYINTREVIFKTPVVCTSTNNQALDNITEGLIEDFQKLVSHKNNVLHERWLDFIYNPLEKYDTDVQKNEVDINIVEEMDCDEEDSWLPEVKNKAFPFKNTIFCPNLKNKESKNIFVISKQKIADILNKSAKSESYFIQQYETYIGSVFEAKESENDRLFILETIAKEMKARLDANIKIIQCVDNETHTAIDMLAKEENRICLKYASNGSTATEIKKAFKDFLVGMDNIKEIVDNIDANEKCIESLQCDILVHTEDIEKFQPIMVEKKKQSDKLKNILLSCEDEFKSADAAYRDGINSDVFKTYNSQLLARLKNEERISATDKALQNIIKAKKYAGFFARFLASFGKGTLVDELKMINANLELKLANIETCTQVQDKAKYGALDKIETFRNERENDLKQAKSEYDSVNSEFTFYFEKIANAETYILSANERVQKCSNNIDTLRQSINSIFDMDDLKILLKHKKAFVLFGQIKQEKEALDTTIRLDNLFYAIHILEALFFIKRHTAQLQNDKDIICPYCKKGKISKLNGKIRKCNQCDLILDKFPPEGLTETEIDVAIRHGILAKGDKLYITSIYESPSGQEMNVSRYIKIQEAKYIDNDAIFKEMLPIFPLISITCNSLGGIATSKNSQNKTIVAQNLFDFMLVDEAGTIPPSKMVIFHTAKRAMLFGDIEQLKPIFAYKTSTEEKLLELFFKKNSTPDFEEIKTVSEYFSCADKEENNIFVPAKANSAMHVANNCMTLFLPYEYSKLQGDIWLKEHYRCIKPIAEISNELVYEKEMVICNTKNGMLMFIETSGEKSSSNTNEEEAIEIVHFIKDKQNMLMQLCELTEENYYENIGIITPFSNQSSLIEEKLNENEIPTETGGIKVGTVHRYQGSARDIIIFSTVYNEKDKDKTANFFFNRVDKAMINVAVTRAKKIFVCFGSREALKAEGTYSDVMMKHIEAFESACSTG